MPMKNIMKPKLLFDGSDGPKTQENLALKTHGVQTKVFETNPIIEVSPHHRNLVTLTKKFTQK